MAIFPDPESWKSVPVFKAVQQISHVFRSLLKIKIRQNCLTNTFRKMLFQAIFKYVHLTQMFWFWLAKCVPPSKLNERTVPVSFPKNHWRHPCGAKLLKPCVHWLIRMIHWLSLLEEPTNAEKSMQSDSRSTYTVICKYWFRLQTK